MLAVSGDTCNVSGSYSTTANGVIAGQATGVNALITGPNAGTVTFSTTGASANGLQADNGGVISLTPTPAAPGTVTTTGVGSIGLLATGSGEEEGRLVASQITIQNVNVSTSGAAVLNGPTANGIESDDGAIANITNGSVTIAATANGAVGVSATGGGQVTISGTTINSNANGSQGLFVTGSGSSLSGSTLNITASGNVDPVTGFYSGAASNNAFGEFAAGGTLSLSNSTLTTTGAQSFGVYTANAGVTTLSNDNITNKGDNALAVESAAGGITTINSGSVTTQGTNSIGVYATGAGSAITANTGVAIKTSGADSLDVEADSGGQVTLNGGSVMTSGIGSTGLYATGAGSSITAAGVAVATSANFDPSNNSTSNGLSAANGATATFSNGSINTAGNAAYAVVATGGGFVSLAGTTIGTMGNGSGGLAVNGSGSEIDAANVTIVTAGALDPLTGLHSYGVFNGPYGDFPAGGVAKLTDVSVSTKGVEMFGVLTDTGGATTILGGSIATSGAGAHAILAENGGTVTVGVSASGPATISTTGTSAPDGTSAAAVVAYDGGAVQLTGATVTTSGAGSTGLVVHGATSSLSASGVTVTTTGGIDPATGDNAVGADNAPYLPGSLSSGGFMSLTNSQIATSGAGANGVVTEAGGSTTLVGTNVSTAGAGANGIFTDAGGVTKITGGSVTTIGSGGIDLFASGVNSKISASGVALSAALGPDAHAIFAYQGGEVDMTGGSARTTGNTLYVGGVYGGGTVNLNGTAISATGLGSGGLFVNGTGGVLNATSVSITTQGGVDPATGDHADGAFNGPYLPGGLTSGGFMSLTNSMIATSGVGANGAESGAGGTTTISGGLVKTTGLEALGIIADGGGNVTVSGTSITTTGDASKGLAALGTGSSLTASDLTVTTSGATNSADGHNAFAVYNGSGAGTSFPGGGTITLTNVAALTTGVGSTGVATENGGVTNIAGGSVSTAGQDAHALFVSGSGSHANLSGVGTFGTTGAGAIGLYAALGGAISATGSTMTTIATSGGVSLATGLGAYGVNADGAGSSIKLGSATIMTSGAGATGLYASDRAASGAAGTISAAGTLNVQTNNVSAAAVALQGDGATIAATGGGTISAAGTAIAFLGGTGQSATFDNFAIGNLSGDLVFADPSVATLNLNNTTANAGNNNLLNATADSAITLNANASMLTGAIRTDATSTTNVNLANNTTWNLTAASTVTNLSVNHSIIVFAPPGAGGAFKTLTVSNYAGNGANITMNVALSGSNSASDQIIINGGKATGSTLLTVNNVGGVGGQTSGNGIPLVVATNGGSVSSGAFSLANAPMVGGFKYTLEETDNSYFLVSSPTATIAGVTNSVNSVAKAQQSQMITNRVLGSILLGATQQISCSSCGGGFASIGSFALGGSGRWSLSDTTTLIGGISYDQWSASGITVNNAPTVAAALVYDFVKWGSSRPFFEAGLGLTPYEQVNYSRTYPNGATTGYGYASATNRDASLFGRAGWVDRLTPIDEAAAYVDLGRSWMQTGGYSEQMTAFNPFPATVPSGLAALNTARLGAQYTHLFNGNIEVNVGGALAYGFGAGAGAPFNISQFGTIAPGAISDSAWFEYGARVGYRMTDRLVVDAFVLGTAGGLAGNFVHGGVGVRYSF